MRHLAESGWPQGEDACDPVFLGDTEITRLGENRLTRLRRSRVGFVFQSFNLLPSLTVLQNVLLPQRLADRRAAMDLLARSA